MKTIDFLICSFPAFNFIKGRADIECSLSEKKVDATDQLFDVVYAPDPWTRLPQSDIAVYLSDKVDPAIKEFVAANLLQPHSCPDGVPDVQSELLFDLVRGDNESVADYALRVQSIIQSDNEVRIKESDFKSELKNELKE